MLKTRIVELAMALTDPWALAHSDLQALFNALAPVSGTPWPPIEALHALRSRARQRQSPPPADGGKVGLLHVQGLLAPRMGHVLELFGTSFERIAKAFDQLSDNADVAHIVLDIDSPGGSIFGAQELSAKIFASSKPVTAVANHVAGSAAYWLASAADELVVSPSGQVGSIGVYAVHNDYSGADAKAGRKRTIIKAGKFKDEGVVGPLPDDAKAAVQDMLDEYREQFVAAVARGRGVSVGTVANGFGEGRMVPAGDAVAMGMADRVGTLDQVLSELGVAG